MSRTVSRLRRFTAATALAGALAIGGTALAASPAFAHDELVGQGFTQDQQTGGVSGITLTFSDSVIKVGTEIAITDPKGAVVSDGDAVVNARDVSQAVKTPLPAGGAYQVAWRVVSSDGHPISGSYAFEVAEDGSAKVTAVSEKDPRFPELEGSAESDPSTGSKTSSESGGVPIGAVAGIGGGLVVVIAATVVLTRRKKPRDTAESAE